jgi:3-hydroxypropionyl-CoA synthetase (ADP-forming)
MPPPLPTQTIALIDRVMAQAAGEGRRALFEHEVYRVLQIIGLGTPRAHFVRHVAEITPQTLAHFSSSHILLKAAAPGMTHKGQAGGIRVVLRDLDFVRYSYERLLNDVRQAGFAPQGALLAEHVDYDKALGNEVLLGFRESEAFGPVISFSKGGSDAEHFARHFSPPNLILAPIDRDWARALLASTHIYHKYVQEGRQHCIPELVQAGVKLSDLAVSFSPSFTGHSRYVFTEFEINPFVFDAQGRFIALDGFAALAPRHSLQRKIPFTPAVESLDPFFKPRGIAVIGISRQNADNPGNIILTNLVRMGRRDVYAVNPHGGEIDLGGVCHPLFPSVSAIPAALDLAVIAVPATQAPAVLEACAVRGVRAAIVIPGGFREVDECSEVEGRMLDSARRHGLRVIGPNCLGIVYGGDDSGPGINTFFVPEDKFRLDLGKHNKVAILSQSGALGLTEIDNLRNALSPKVIVSYGNQLDVDPADLVAYFDRDPAVAVIGCYVEGFAAGGGRKFFGVAARAHKPIVVYKAGRTPAGQRAAASHTASIAGEYAVARAAMKQAGLIVADSMIDHGDLIKTFALLNDCEVRGNRIAVIANAGYEKTYAADHLDGLEIATFDAATQAELRRLLPPYVNVEPLLDLTPMAGDEIFESCMRAVLQAEGVDALLVSVVPHSSLLHTTDAEIAQDPDNLAERIVRLVRAQSKPTVVSVNVAFGAGAVYNRFGQILDSGGVPTYLTANRAMVCLNAFVRYRLTRAEREYGEWLK